MQAEDWTSAKASFDKAAQQLQGTELEEFAHYNASISALVEGDAQEAIERAKQTLRLNPNNDDARHNLALAQRVQQQQQQQEQQDQEQQEQEEQEQEPRPGPRQGDDSQQTSKTGIQNNQAMAKNEEDPQPQDGQEGDGPKEEPRKAKSAGPTWSEFWKVWSGKNKKSKRNCARPKRSKAKANQGPLKKIGDIPLQRPAWLVVVAAVRGGPRAPAHAQRDDARVELTVNATDVQSGDMLRLSLTFVNCEVRNIDPPDVKGLEFRMGPSTSNSTSWVNGVTTSEQRYTYNYKVVGSGEISIPAQTWKTSEGPLKSNPVRLFASGRAQPSRTKSRNGTTQRQPTRDLVTAIEPSKRTLYLGEPVVLNYKIYNRYNNLDVRNYDIPELDGFWKETVDMPEARWEPQLINGKRYNVATVRKVVAFPQQTGTFELKDFDPWGTCGSIFRGS